jgi:hypothetical protein
MMALSLGVFLCGGSFAQQPADQSKIEENRFPDGMTHDFGAVPCGTQLKHVFRIVNTSDVALKIEEVRVSMAGCVTAQSNKRIVQPKEEATVTVMMDGQRFLGTKTVRTFVTVNDGKPLTHSLVVSANCRDDLVISPASFDFGNIKRGDTPTKKVVVTVSKQTEISVTKLVFANRLLHVQVRELSRDMNSVSFEVTATIRAEVPARLLSEAIELRTNSTSLPSIRVPVSARVE